MNNLYNKCINRIRKPVTLIACAMNLPELLTSYAGRYVQEIVA